MRGSRERFFLIIGSCRTGGTVLDFLISFADRPVEEQGRVPAVFLRIYSNTDSLYINIGGLISWSGEQKVEDLNDGDERGVMILDCYKKNERRIAGGLLMSKP
ncbi:hypothetical protein H206_03615 [Candidatus Electrothrix aarhusensis]|uniref:Uncharacterized protein n=1 Tax=Candidatus Electrothrix aarhusensis TaxID=1859131 RepID=A0A3S3UCZ4_9BACT|nr:hypothetical protein H206_03615 [Candidatus Electrothrix aarhusensis]